MTTLIEVKATFENELHAIFALDQILAEERSSIKRKAFVEGRALTGEEVASIKDIAAVRAELTEAMEVLALDTVNALENSEDVDKLVGKIETVNKNLQNDLDRLKQIAKYAARVAAVTNGIAGVVTNLIDFKNIFI